MKHVLLIPILFAIPYMGLSQRTNDIPIKDGGAFYERIAEIDKATKSELFSRANVAIARIFRESKAVIQMSDQESGRILGKGNYQFLYGSFYSIGVQTLNPSFVIDVQVKDGKYRIQLYDFTFRKYSTDGFMSKTESWKDETLEFYTSRAKSKKWAAEAVSKFHQSNEALLNEFQKQMANGTSDF